MALAPLDTFAAGIGKLSAEKKDIFVDGMAEKMASAEAQTKLTASIQALANTSVNIRNQFRDVRLILEAADNAELKGTKPLAPEWTVLQTDYEDLLDTSHRTAMDSVVLISDYLGAIELAGDQHSSLDDKKKGIAAVLKQIDGSQASYTQAIDMKNRFMVLSGKVTTFANAELPNYGDEQAKLWRDEISNLNLDIEEFDGTIASIDQKFAGLVAELNKATKAVDTVNSVTGFLGALFSFAPLVAMGVMAVGSVVGGVFDNSAPARAAVDKAVQERKAAETGKAEKQEALKGIEAKADNLGKIKASFVQVKATTVTIADGIMGFSNVWNIAMDARKVEGLLKSTSDASGIFTFNRNVRLSVAGYTALSNSFEEYAKMLTHEKAQ